MGDSRPPHAERHPPVDTGAALAENVTKDAPPSLNFMQKRADPSPMPQYAPTPPAPAARRGTTTPLARLAVLGAAIALALTAFGHSGAAADTSFTFNGGGWGHGVGMSQYGARYMSLHGYNFAKILQHYYSHVAIGTIPLHIGQNQGARLSFYVPPLSKPATLNISSESGLPSPPTVLINSKRVTMPWGSISTARSINLDPYLKAGTVNQLIIKPSRSGTAKAWIELVDGSSAPKST